MTLYTFESVMKIRNAAFRKAIADIRVSFSGFSGIEIKNMVKAMKCDVLIDYIENDVFPFDFE